MKGYLLTCLMCLFSSIVSAQSIVLDGGKSAELKETAKFFAKKRDMAASLLAKELKAEDLIKTIAGKENWQLNDQITFKEHYTDSSCGDVEPEKEEYVTGSLLVSKKPEFLNKPYKLQLMFPFDVTRESGAYVSFCNLKNENGNIIQSCDAGATFVLSYSKCDKSKNACLVEFENFYVYKSGIKLNLYSYVKSNNFIRIAYYGAHGFRDCAISYMTIKSILI